MQEEGRRECRSTITPEVRKSMPPKDRTAILNRPSRIKGQVRGTARMLDEDRYCIDILNQVQAVKAALGKVEEELLKDHAAHCVEDAIQRGNAVDQRRKFDELVALFGRLR